MSSKYRPILDWSCIEASAPGGIVVSGEFDLYEKSAIAIALDCKTRVTIRPYEEGRLRLNLKNYNIIREWPITSFTMTKLVNKYADIISYSETMPVGLNRLLHDRYYESELPEAYDFELQADSKLSNCKTKRQQADDGTIAFLLLYVGLGDSYAWSTRPSLNIEVESDIPINRGMSSSSAYAAALCIALMKVFHVSAEPSVIISWVTSIDTYFHGKASGLTASVAVHGGYIFFQNNKVKHHGIQHANPVNVMLIDTGIRRDPRLIHRKLAADLSKNYHKVNNILRNIHDLTVQVWKLFNDPQFVPRAIGLLMNQNNAHLEALGMGHDRISEIYNRGAMYKLYTKQTRGGESVFLLYDHINKLERIKEFKVHLEESGYLFKDYELSHDKLKVVVSPSSQ